MNRISTRSRGIHLETFFGSAEIGLFAVPTEDICLVPPRLKLRQKRLIQEVLGVKVTRRLDTPINHGGGK